MNERMDAMNDLGYRLGRVITKLITERNEPMRFDVSNWEDLRIAVTEMDKTDEPKVIVFNTPGGVLHRYIISQFGVEKEDCDGAGGKLYDSR